MKITIFWHSQKDVKKYKKLLKKMSTSGKSFVKLPGPINLGDDSDDEINNSKQKSSMKKTNSILKNQTPKIESSKQPNKTPKQSPQTEITLSPMGYSPENMKTPTKMTRKSDSLFTPNSPVPTPKQQEERLKTTTMTFHDETKNYSTILKHKSPVVAKNTQEASIGETYRKLYHERKAENQSLLHKKSQLEVYYRKSKLENQQLLARQRESNTKLEEASPRDIEKFEKKILKAEEKMNMKKLQQSANSQYKEIVRINQKVRDIRNSEKQVLEGLSTLNSLMSYSLRDSDIDNILLTNKFEGEIGAKFSQFLLSLQECLPKLEKNDE